MIRLAVIGTNWITDKFIEAAELTKKIKLVAVYSRNSETAQAFAAKYQINLLFTDIDELARSTLVDAVYIASPNALHYSQAKQLLMHHKAVIGEKPLTSNRQQSEALIELALQHNSLLFEAFKVPYLPNFKLIQDWLPKLGPIRKVFFNYCQYSSRYPRYLAGENPNTFNPAFSNGSLMDIGIYPLGAALALWGAPQKIMANAMLLASGVDGHGSLLLDYGQFDVVIWHSKVSDSTIPSEIQGEAGSLIIEHLSVGEKVTYWPRQGTPIDITLPQVENTMYYEAERFAELYLAKQYNHEGLALSLLLSTQLTKARQLTGVVFPADSAPL